MTRIDRESVELLAAYIRRTCGCALGDNAELPVAGTILALLAALDEAEARADRAAQEARALALQEVAEMAANRRDHYANLTATAERRGPSYPGYVRDATFEHWSGKCSAYSEMATDTPALMDTTHAEALERVRKEKTPPAETDGAS